ncbi:hypothetical protein CI102_8075 [Trichoderma harzianum]|jgi:hypothetical protein|nr:hypothetical protein CI102_8075 [Trichoderma harzianum]
MGTAKDGVIPWAWLAFFITHTLFFAFSYCVESVSVCVSGLLIVSWHGINLVSFSSKYTVAVPGAPRPGFTCYRSAELKNVEINLVPDLYDNV